MPFLFLPCQGYRKLLRNQVKKDIFIAIIIHVINDSREIRKKLKSPVMEVDEDAKELKNIIKLVVHRKK